jgi:tripartite-type tricarboxylate transporter receptor subunit TctC
MISFANGVVVRRMLLAGFAMACGATAPQVASQPFPNKPIRIVVGAGVSTPSDILSRVLASELSNSEKWTVIVENRPGASQVIGGTEVFKSPADGYTIFNSGLPIAAAPALQAKIPFDLLKDFQSVIQIARSYNVLVVHPSLEAKSLPDLVKLLKAQPDKLNYSSGGLGTPAHLVGELFRQQADVRAAHVPYVQFPQAITDLLNGTNHYMFITTLPVMGLIGDGKLRALAVTSPQRLPALRDVPTVAEQGYAGLTVGDWSGMMVRTETPAAIVTQLNGALNKSLQASSVKEAFARVAAEPVGGAPDVFAKQLREDVEKWGKVIATAGVKPK